ncbi:hypothetical protein [Caenimonas sp. SL110]|uniref:hypothetical protein n=1 Tax=Caenimonas sp. SL110 TaxID=1450524 RepID=UPI0006547330|nr:hypothetical protein [Caenimonas sp. SL110]
MPTTTNLAAAAWKYFRTTRSATAGTPPHDNKHAEEPNIDLRTATQRPTTGRTSAAGRKVEKPGTGKSSGPSGQPDEFKHGLVHTNK